MNLAVAIMAGGKGERFWPKSRDALPKQFLSLTDNGKTMLQLTVDRITPIVCIDNIFIITNKKYAHLVKEQLPNISEDNILCEPMPKNTAPCVALAAAIIEKRLGESVMIVLPADHLIKNETKFIDTLRIAINHAEKSESLITLGITPTHPDTGYGYINFVDNLDSKYHTVIRFVEKPDSNTAQEYLNDGHYLWNSGMFIWKTSVILEKFKELMPEVYEKSITIQQAYMTDDFDDVLNSEFVSMPSDSIDYGIMEKASQIITIPCDFGWDDVGGWLAVERINSIDNNKNYAHGEWINISSKGCTIVGDKRLIATIGLDDIVIVDTDDVLLVCKKSMAQDVKKVVSELRQNNKIKYL